MPPINQAAWITSPGAHPFVVKDAAYPTPGPGEVVIRNAAVAVNPVDWKIQYHSHDHAWLSNYPFILGSDCAGTIHEVGEGVTRFKEGDRVIAFCPSLPTLNPSHSSFQTYTLVPATHAILIPATLSFPAAAVLPLALATAASGLYLPDQLGLALPALALQQDEAITTTPPKKTILITGGSSSVGLSAIQLAHASGLVVIATASRGNFALVRSAGADAVVDYTADSAVSEILALLPVSGVDFAGVYDAISSAQSFRLVKCVVERFGRGDVAVPVVGVGLAPEGLVSEWFKPRFAMGFWVLAAPYRQIGEYLFGEFVPAALEKGMLQALPEALVVGRGLGVLQDGVDVLRGGVSARKIVVEL